MLDSSRLLRGLMVAAFAAAYMSTIGTQLNWGASLLVNDVYRRFLKKSETEKHYVSASQVATIVLMNCSAVGFVLHGIDCAAWKFLMALGPGREWSTSPRWFLVADQCLE